MRLIPRAMPRPRAPRPAGAPAPRPPRGGWRVATPAVALAALAVALAGCGAKKTAALPAPSSSDGMRVLFVGNSLTYGNDLPRVVQAMAAAGGVKMKADAVMFGGFGLEDHWNGGAAHRKLDEGTWEYVVLQQGPSSQPDSSAHLKKWTQKWAEVIRKHGAKPALYMVWPFEGPKPWFERVAKSYRGAAEASQSLILPAGEAWQVAIERDPDVRLYQEDRLHPTGAGTYLAALVITHGLTGVKPSAVPSSLKLASGAQLTIREAHAKTLRQAAEEITGAKP